MKYFELVAQKLAVRGKIYFRSICKWSPWSTGLCKHSFRIRYYL